jgi:hypothetical protein
MHCFVNNKQFHHILVFYNVTDFFLSNLFQVFSIFIISQTTLASESDVTTLDA